MSAPAKLAVDDTQPIPRIAYGQPKRTWYIGDRLSDSYPDASGKVRRYVGQVIECEPYIFRVRWDFGYGIATFVHGHEPTSLRGASSRDEFDARRDHDRAAVAGELRRLAEMFGVWPAEVRHELRRRAAELAGS